ncbi:uncharacterized protein LOC143293635 [Babylonia areolata]|uniref:uncharacterized protein LOC143293635 n=1 Tax=Babylonia areolata TaxID=304850 RepID=UPI003FD01D7D
MSEGRPTDLEEGYLGEQPRFAEVGMECVSHKTAEFTVPQENEAEIKFRVSAPVKSTCNLIQVRTEQDFPQYVFTQTCNEQLSYVISFPEHGWYKFQIFALPASDPNKSLPNVFNYLIDVRRALKAVYHYPKQYAQWRNGCYLYNPLILNSSSRLHNVPFKVLVPKAKQVAVVAAGEWTQLEKAAGAADTWEGHVSVDQHRGKGVKVTLNACFGEDESKFATLLEYVV